MENASSVQPLHWSVGKRRHTVWLAACIGLGIVVILSSIAALNPIVAVACSVLVLLIPIVMPRPALIVYTLALTLPLTAGLTKINAIPLLRLPQALLVLGFVLFVLAKPTSLSKSRLTAVDLAFVIFVLSEDVFPVLTLYYRGEHLDFSNSDVLQALLRPIQYYLLYRIVVATIVSEKQIRILLKLLFVASIIVSMIGILEKLNVGPVERFLQTYYPIPLSAGGYVAANLRIASTLGYYSGLGAYLCFTIIIALVCYIARDRIKISLLLLVTTALLDSIAMILTGTFTSWIGLAIGAVVVFLLSKRLPRIVFFVLVGIILAAFIFQPFIAARLNEQLAPGAAQGLLPQSFAYRIMLWQEQTLPQISRNLFFGVGPAPANAFEDSMYIYLLLEGGLCFFFGYLLLIGVTIAICWHQIKYGRKDIGWLIAVATLAILIAMNVMNVAEEYFTYIGGTQTLWMLMAIVVASGQIKAQRASATAVPVVRGDRRQIHTDSSRGMRTAVVGMSAQGHLTRERLVSSYSVVPSYAEVEENRRDQLYQHFSWLRRVLDWHFVKDSLVVGIASTMARVLGLLFAILLAHYMTHDDYGFVRYSMALAGIMTIASYASPVSIARFLAANVHNQQARDRYFSNSLVGAVILLAAALLLAVPILWLLHALNFGIFIYMIGIAVPAYYSSVVRGLNNAWKMGLTYLLTNVNLIIVVFVLLGFLGLRTTTFALACSGLANLITPLIIEAFRPISLRFRSSLLSKATLRELAYFALPIVVSTGSFTLWTGIDLVVVQHIIPHASGSYATAETFAGAFIFVPTAIVMVLMPRVAAMEPEKGKRYTLGAALVAFLVSVIGLGIVYVWGQSLIVLIFGQNYADAYSPLLVQGIGMTFFSVYTILEGFIIGRGRPHLPAQAVIVATISTYVTIFWLTSWLGMLGASLSFTIGAILGTVAMLFNTWRVLRSDKKETIDESQISVHSLV